MVDDIGPKKMSEFERPIEERAASNMPETFNALRKSALFGTAFSAAKTEYVKYKLFATVVKPEEESATYNPLVLEYAGKILSLQLIGPGMDYWGSVEQRVTVTGTNETVSFLDRVKMLMELQKRLISEAEELLPAVEDTINIVSMIKARPRVSPVGTDKTPDPQQFPAEFMQDAQLLWSEGAWEA